MSLEKQTTLDQISVSNTGVVYISFNVSILENGEKLSEFYTYKSIAPGDDYSQEDNNVKNICVAIHTPQTIAEYQRAKAA